MHAALDAYARLVCDQPAAAANGARLAMSVLLRRACSSATSLARSVQRRLALLGTSPALPAVQPSLPFGDERDDEEPDEVLGAAGLADATDECARLEHLLGLARTAGEAESKPAAVRRLLRRAREPVIVFTEYRDTLRHLRDAIAEPACVELHGGLTRPERAEALRDFAGGRARLLLATDAASEGLNLHHRCRLVVNLEVPWTPLRLEQRIGRVDRIGQRRRVHAVNLVAADTSEEAMVTRIAERRSRVELHGDDVREVDLAAEAGAEAGRISTARRLLADERDTAEMRPLLTRIRSRRRARVMRCYWLFRLQLAAADARPVIAVCLPLGGTASGRLPMSSAATRRLLDTRATGVSEAFERAQDASRRSLGTHTEREQALRNELLRHQARLSADLLQPGLFDRRQERAAAAQAALLDHALAASSVRLEQLSAAGSLHVESCELVFGVAVE
jgi:superfamily II DNA/RNA helicase